VGPWTLRNARELHAFVPVTTGGGRALLDSNNSLIWDDPDLRGGAMSVYNVEPYASRLKGLSEAQGDAVAGSMALKFMRSRVSQWPQVALAKLGRFWRLTSEGGPLTGGWRRGGTPLDAIRRWLDPLLAWSIVVLPLALWGAAMTLRGGKRLFLSLPLLAIALFTLSAIVYWGALRMRVPIEPLVALYAAAGVDDLRRRGRVRRGHLTLVEGTKPA
jgi:hypothetical protein